MEPRFFVAMRHFKFLEKRVKSTARGGVELLNKQIRYTLLTALIGATISLTNGFLTRDRIATLENESKQTTQRLEEYARNRGEFSLDRALRDVHNDGSNPALLQPTTKNTFSGWLSQLGMSTRPRFTFGRPAQAKAIPAPRYIPQRYRVTAAFASWLPYQGRNVIADNAVKGLTGTAWPKTGGWCQKWVRITLEHAHGAKFSRFMRSSAKLTAAAFLASPYVIDPRKGTLPGDIGYKVNGSGGFGHVGIRGWGNVMLENTSWNGDGDGDARTARSLKEWGKADVWVRLH